MTSVLIVVLVTLGGLGVFLALPQGRSQLARAAVIPLLGALGALAALVMQRPRVPTTGEFFLLFSVISLWAGVRVVTHPKPVYSALYFILLIFSVAGHLIVMEATFLAAAVVIIYGGAILVTYAFVIMLAQQSGGPALYDASAREPLLGALAGFLLLALLAVRITGAPELAPGDVRLGWPREAAFGVPAQAAVAEVPPAVPGTLEAVGISLLTEYTVAVQVAGVLLLAAMVGAVAIAKRKATEEAWLEEAD